MTICDVTGSDPSGSGGQGGGGSNINWMDKDATVRIFSRSDHGPSNLSTQQYALEACLGLAL